MVMLSVMVMVMCMLVAVGWDLISARIRSIGL